MARRLRAGLIAAQCRLVHYDLRGSGGTGVGAVELAELPLAGQQPEGIVHARLQPVLQIGVDGAEFQSDLRGHALFSRRWFED